MLESRIANLAHNVKPSGESGTFSSLIQGAIGAGVAVGSLDLDWLICNSFECRLAGRTAENSGSLGTHTRC